MFSASSSRGYTHARIPALATFFFTKLAICTLPEGGCLKFPSGKTPVAQYFISLNKQIRFYF
jgi:hypothetical protein